MNKKRPLIGFFPLFDNLAETGRALKIALECLNKSSVDILFFSHGGKYEYLVEKMGFKILKTQPIQNDEFITSMEKYARLEKLRNPINSKIMDGFINGEIKVFKDTNVDLIVSTNNFWSIISSRKAKIPLITVTPKVKKSFIIYPDDADFLFLRFLPNSIKLKILNWYVPKTKWMSKSFNKAAKRYKINIKKMTDFDLVKGDYTLYTDLAEFIDLNYSEISSNEFFIGPISFEGLPLNNKKNEDKQIEEDVIKHLKKPGRTILLTLGSSGTKKIFIDILKTLNNTDYNVIAIHASILDDENLPFFNDNILIKKFVPSIEKIYEKIDLAIIHGGQGTVYNVAYAGKPVIGIPMQFEQHLNLENFVREKTGLIISRKYFRSSVLLNSIQKIFYNYDKYLSKAKKLSEKLPKTSGEKKAAELIISILKKNQ